MPNITAKYSGLIAEINKRVGDFNASLASGYHFRRIHPEDPATFAVIRSPNWISEPLPSNCRGGVFILGAHDEKVPSRLGVYVGRSSLKTVRYGIRSALNLYKAIDPCALQVGSATFCIDVILVVPVNSRTTRSMACALHEEIVKWGLKSADLINGIGTLPVP